MAAIVHTPADIVAILHRGLTPITDNGKALEQLGFVRAYPESKSGYRATIWEREPRQLRERAILVD